MNKVSFVKANYVRLRAWIMFILSLGIMAGFWYGCWWLVATYAPQGTIYFKWGGIIAIAIGSTTLVFNELIVRSLMNAKRVKTRGDCPELWDAVMRAKPKTMFWTPRIYHLPSSGVNAISFGWGLPFMSAIGATEGAICHFNDEELAAVMAHEIGHIINKDILVSTAMTITVLMSMYTGWLLLRLGPYSGNSRSRRSSSSDSKGASAILIIMLVGGLLYIFGRLLGIVLQMFVSRQREYAADAASARIMGSSQPLISALTTIERVTNGFRPFERAVRSSRIGPREYDTLVGALCFEDPDPEDMMSTHPKMSKRLRALANLET
jgi:heat shock protein HtpX